MSTQIKYQLTEETLIPVGKRVPIHDFNKVEYIFLDIPNAKPVICVGLFY